MNLWIDIWGRRVDRMIVDKLMVTIWRRWMDGERDRLKMDE